MSAPLIDLSIIQRHQTNLALEHLCGSLSCFWLDYFEDRMSKPHPPESCVNDGLND